MKRVMERLNTDDEEFVRREVEYSDEAHGAIIRRHFGVNWQESELYDLALNSERVPVDGCIEEILSLVRKASFAPTPQSQATLDNLSLAAQVRAALRTDTRTRKVDILIESDAGHVTLAGVVTFDIALATLTEVAAQVAGVHVVENRVKQAVPFR